MKKICHLTSVHPRNDIRIFRKQCISLQQSGYDVNYIVADDLGDEEVSEIHIFDVKSEDSRIKRMTKIPKRVYSKALELDADLYHFHDPELIPIGLKLLRKGKKVIYDVHEDLPRQIMGKPYINRLIKPIVAFFIERYENYASKKMTFIFTATSHIRDRFLKLNSDTIDINNFPILNELHNDCKLEDKKDQICYIGGISEIRGIKQLVDSLEFSEYKLLIAGVFESEKLKQEVMNSPGWPHVEELGFVDRNGVKDILRESKAGMVTFLGVPNHTHSQPNKIFEYMSASLPVVGSDFDLWKDIIEANNCGICIDPEDPKSISDAVIKIVNDPELIKTFGTNGRKAVEQKYNWQKEENKLKEIYKKVL